MSKNKFQLMFSVLLIGMMVVAFLPQKTVSASGTITVNPQNESWIFTDDGFPGGIGEYVSGPGIPLAGTGSVHFALPGNARMAVGTQAYANTPLSEITTLRYSTYRTSYDSGNNLAVALTLDIDYDLTDSNTSWQGRLTYEPYMTNPGQIQQSTWQTWNTLEGKWWASGSPGNTQCPQDSPCTFQVVKQNWPNAGIRVGGFLWLKAGGPWSGFDGNADQLVIGINGDETIYDFEPSNSAHLSFAPTLTLIPVGGTTDIYIHLNSVRDLYGYQLQVSYAPSVVSATATFVNTWFNTASDASIVPGWNAACSSGICQFAVTKLNPALPIQGSGILAKITLTGLSPGTSTISFSSSLLADRNGTPISRTSGTTNITVYGSATVSGVVALQGRLTPIDPGSVKFTDQSGTFPVTTVLFDANSGAFTAVLPVLPSGTPYTIDAAHVLYLTNRQSRIINLADTINLGTTTLKGGDANNDGTISIADLTCIGGDFGKSGNDIGTCSGTGSPDINKDSIVNILDLVLAGGNYGLSSPLTW